MKKFITYEYQWNVYILPDVLLLKWLIVLYCKKIVGLHTRYSSFNLMEY
jgi:hypothetical protein